MPSLLNCLNQILALPFDELDQKYASNGSDAARRELESLPRTQEIIADEILEELHSKIRRRQCETPIWAALVFLLNSPLPAHLAHDLIDRDIAVTQLGHVRQTDEVQWRLASLVDEALLTLVWDLFTKPSYSVAELEKLLAQHPIHFWLLSKWEHWAFLSPLVRDGEKEVVFHRWAWQHPKDTSPFSKRPLDVPTPERYLEMLHGRKQERLRTQQKAEEERARDEQAAAQRCAELQLLSQRSLMEGEIEAMFSRRDPDEILALASNVHLPTLWLQKLLNCYGLKGARQIRGAAQENFQSRRMDGERKDSAA